MHSRKQTRPFYLRHLAVAFTTLSLRKQCNLTTNFFPRNFGCQEYRYTFLELCCSCRRSDNQDWLLIKIAKWKYLLLQNLNLFQALQFKAKILKMAVCLPNKTRSLKSFELLLAGFLVPNSYAIAWLHHKNYWNDKYKRLNRLKF